MNFQFYTEKLQNSKEFRQFKKKYPKAYFCTGFFVVDKEGKDNKVHLDYFLPKSKEIVSFQLEQGIKQVPVEIIDKKVPQELSEKQDFDFDEIEKIIVKEMEKKAIKSKIQKIILSLQRLKDRNFLVGTVFISMLGMLKVQIDIKDKKIIQFEKRSFFDIMKVVKRK